MQKIRAYWQPENNWGDRLTPYIVEKITGERPVWFNKPGKLLMVGSVLHHAKTGDTVCGAGMISPTHKPQSEDLKVLAVRGKKTREMLLKMNIDCPEVYGDYALVLPLLYQPKVKKEFRIGIVPHYMDVEPAIEYAKQLVAQNWAKNEEINIISVCLPIEEFINEVNKCERIYSSSLHGIICADAYQIPAERVVLSDRLIGGDFKFDDYESSKGEVDEKKLIEIFKNWYET